MSATSGRDWLMLTRGGGIHKDGLRGLVIGRVIERDTVATPHEARKWLLERNRYNTVCRAHFKGFGFLYLNAKV